MSQNNLIGLIYVAAITIVGAWVSAALYARHRRSELSQEYLSPASSASPESSQTLTEYCQDGLGI